MYHVTMSIYEEYDDDEFDQEDCDFDDFYCEEEPITLTKTDAMQSFKECMAFVEESFRYSLKSEIDKSDPAYYLFLLLSY